MRPYLYLVMPDDDQQDDANVLFDDGELFEPANAEHAAIPPEKPEDVPIAPPKERPRIFIRIQTAVTIGIIGFFLLIALASFLSLAGPLVTGLGGAFVGAIGFLIINAKTRRAYGLHLHQLYVKDHLYDQNEAQPNPQIIRIGHWFPDTEPDHLCIVALATHAMFHHVTAVKISSEIAPKGFTYTPVRKSFSEGRNVMTLKPSPDDPLAKHYHAKLRDLAGEEDCRLKVKLYGTDGTRAELELKQYKSI